jgi:hypothetical protein
METLKIEKPETAVVRVVTEVDDALYRSLRDAYNGTQDELPLTVANLMLCLKRVEYMSTENCGSLGSIGAGSTWAEIETEDGKIITLRESDYAIIAEYDNNDWLIDLNSLDDGELTRAQIDSVTGSVWDGNNHVTIEPGSLDDYCDEADIEEFEWGTVTFRNENGVRCTDSIDVADGWVEIGDTFDGSTNSEMPYELFRNYRDEIAEMGEVEKYEDTCECVYYFCRESDFATILERVQDLDNEG